MPLRLSVLRAVKPLRNAKSASEGSNFTATGLKRLAGMRLFGNEVALALGSKIVIGWPASGPDLITVWEKSPCRSSTVGTVVRMS